MRSFPFGKEEELSVNAQLTAFCNNVYLGQWEMARALADQLKQQNHNTLKDIHAIIQHIISRPDDTR